MPTAIQSLDMKHDEDPKEVIWRELGTRAEKIHPLGAQIIVGIYQRPESTKGGIILSDKTRGEDFWQGKIGLVMKMGPLAFTEDGAHSYPVKPKVGDWIVFRVGDTLGSLSGKRMIRFLDEGAVRAIIDEPDLLY